MSQLNHNAHHRIVTVAMLSATADGRGRPLSGIHSSEAVVRKLSQKVVQCSSFPIFVGNFFISLR